MNESNLLFHCLFHLPIFVGMFVADLTGATGHYYWSIVIVMFLLFNELCFGNYDFELNFDEDETDDEYDWMEDDE